MSCFVLGVIYLISNLNIFLHVYWPFEFLPFQLPGHKRHPFFNWSISSLFIDFKKKNLINFSLFILVILTLFVLQILASLTLKFVF